MGSRLNKTRNDDSFKRNSNNKEFFTEDRYKEICFNFRYLDRNQGQTYKDWEEEKILSIMLERFEHLSKQNIMEAQKSILTIYAKYPDDCGFKKSGTVPENAKWASIRIQGKERVIGFIENNLFYVVFLDKDHEFWPSPKKHT